MHAMNLPETKSVNPSRSRLFRLFQALEGSAAISYILDSQYRLLHCNPAWDDFAISNGAPQLEGEQVIGSVVFEAIPEVLKTFCTDAFAKALIDGVWEVRYECSSPSLFRKYRMRVHSLTSRGMYMVTNALIHEGPHRDMVEPDSRKYVQSNGLITMCAHCRCSRRVDAPNQWDFVSEYLHLKGYDSLMVSHGICPICHACFYS